jgi:hypothetical protein
MPALRRRGRRGRDEIGDPPARPCDRPPLRPFRPSDFAGLRDAFLDFVPDEGRLFRPEVGRCDAEGLDIKFHACPLKEAWHAAGLVPEKIATLCRIAGVVDDVTFEAAGFAFAADTWRPGEEGCCFLHIRPGPAPA